MEGAITPQEEIIRSGHAKEVLDSAIFKEMRESIGESIHQKIVGASFHDQTLHTRLVLMAQLWDTVEKWFDQIKTTGEMASIQIEQEKQRKSLMERLRVV